MSAAILLASGSPRRRELLEQLGLTFAVVAPDVDESPLAEEMPVAYVARVAIDKVNAVEADPDALVIAADTTVDLDGTIIAKPVDLDDARVILRRLSGRTHAVHTGVALRRNDRCVSATVTSQVTFVTLSDAGVEWYVGTGEPLGKAGAYAIQGAGAVLVQSVEGSVTNIIGLPLPTVIQLARQLDVSLLGV
ncbi:MAG: Maf family protein [Actinomycetia bacterium]|nr:Maf family protein [Actinomycetes bacterium]